MSKMDCKEPLELQSDARTRLFATACQVDKTYCLYITFNSLESVEIQTYVHLNQNILEKNKIKRFRNKIKDYNKFMKNKYMQIL